MTDVIERSIGRIDSPPAGEAYVPMAPLYDTAAALLRHPRLMVFVPGLMFALTVTWAWMGKEFTAQSRITPQQQDNSALSGIIGTAAQFGVSVPNINRQNESVDFYADLVKSRELLDSLALTSFWFVNDRDERDTLSGTYVQLNKIKGKTTFDQVYRARRTLEGKVSVTIKRPSGLVTVQTRAKWGRLAELMNRRVLDLVNAFNLKRRQTAARAEREFLERRMVDVGAELKDAQGVLRTFRERNRSFQDDPGLLQESQDLTRKVTEELQLYQQLLLKYENARVDEVRNIPVITIVEAPEGSRKRSSGVLMSGALGLLAGGLLAAGIALALEYATAERSRNPEAYDAFRRLWSNLPQRILGRPR